MGQTLLVLVQTVDSKWHEACAYRSRINILSVKTRDLLQPVSWMHVQWPPVVI